MALGITLYIRPPLSGGKFPEELPISELEKKMQESFASRGMKVVEEYFSESSDFYPKLKFVIFCRNRYKSLISGLIATEEEIFISDASFKFTYYDKIFVVRSRRGNGLMGTMIKTARQIAKSTGKGGTLPAGLRTSDSKLHESYASLSDIHARVDDFYIHGFGFLDKKNKNELFEGAKSKFYSMADYITLKPRTVVPIQPLIYQ